MTAALVALWAAAPASAADQTVATVPRTTTVDAYAGHAVWSTYDPATKTYHLTEWFKGKTRTLDVAASRHPFEDVDLGPGPNGRPTAVFSRCRKGSSATVRGCDLYSFRLAGNRMVKLHGPNTTADEEWPTIWHRRLAFVRHDRPYLINLSGGPVHPLRHGPVEDGAWPEALDMRARRVTFIWQHEYGAELQTTSLGHRARTLVGIPGSGGADRDYFPQGPTLMGDGHVYWGIAADTDEFPGEIRRVGVAHRRQQRATTRIPNPSPDDEATVGYAKDSKSSWYVRALADKSFEIHRATGLKWEKAPPLELE